VRVALRHATRPGAGKSVLHFGNVVADLEKHVVKRDGVEIHLTALEFRLLTREKLEADPVQPRHLLTETGVGYRLLAEED
jgi:two-component system KDP operon response regulator KdpE